MQGNNTSALYADIVWIKRNVGLTLKCNDRVVLVSLYMI